jgi:hypothetical protein
VGDEREAEQLDEQAGEDEGEALAETCEQEKSSEREQPA